MTVGSNLHLAFIALSEIMWNIVLSSPPRMAVFVWESIIYLCSLKPLVKIHALFIKKSFNLIMIKQYKRHNWGSLFE